MCWVLMLDCCCGTTSEMTVWYMARLAPVRTLLRHSDDMGDAEEDTKNMFTKGENSDWSSFRTYRSIASRLLGHIYLITAQNRKKSGWHCRTVGSVLFEFHCLAKILLLYIHTGGEGRTQVSSGEFHLEEVTPPSLLLFPENLINKTNLPGYSLPFFVNLQIRANIWPHRSLKCTPSIISDAVV